VGIEAYRTTVGTSAVRLYAHPKPHPADKPGWDEAKRVTLINSATTPDIVFLGKDAAVTASNGFRWNTPTLNIELMPSEALFAVAVSAQDLDIIVNGRGDDGLTDFPGLQAPTNFSVSEQDTQLAPLFYPVAGATGYDYTLNGGSSWITNAPTSAFGPFLIITAANLINGDVYQVAVRARDAGGPGLQTNIMSASPNGPVLPSTLHDDQPPLLGPGDVYTSTPMDFHAVGGTVGITLTTDQNFTLVLQQTDNPYSGTWTQIDSATGTVSGGSATVTRSVEALQRFVRYVETNIGATAQTTVTVS
jgi:hypothetical protein